MSGDARLSFNAFTSCSCHRIKAIFRQFELILLSNIRTVRLSVSADIRLSEGGHKLCSRQLTVNRPTAKAAKQPSWITARSAASWLWQANILSSMRAIILIYAQVQLLYGVYICAWVCVCVCYALFAAGKININCKNCQSQRQKIKRECNEKRSNSKGNSNTRTCCASSLTNTHTHAVRVCVYACVCVLCTIKKFLSLPHLTFEVCAAKFIVAPRLPAQKGG